VAAGDAKHLSSRETTRSVPAMLSLLGLSLAWCHTRRSGSEHGPGRPKRPWSPPTAQLVSSV